MKSETTYRWRIQWAGKWTTTKYNCTEDQIRREHPEAICLVESKRVDMVPETDAEIRELQRASSTSVFQRPK